MLEIKSIKVSNFYSLGDIELPITNGLHYVLGINNDTESSQKSSNGSGKTASFSALYQGLYNKNIKNPKGVLDSVNNSVTGKPYSITIDLVKNAKTHYSIINNRSNNKIIITEDGKEIQVKGIAGQLKQIKDVIGLDFDTLTSLTYISQGTLQAILDTTNKDNILYQFFNVEAIHSIEDLLKEERKELKTFRTVLIARLRSSEKSLSLLTSFEKVDVLALEGNLKVLTESALKLTKDKRYTQLTFLEKTISINKEKSTTILGEKTLLHYRISELKQKVTSLRKGVCPTCGQGSTLDVVPFENSLKEAESEDLRLARELKELEDLAQILNRDHKNIKDSLESDVINLNQKINIIKSKLLVVAEQNSQYDKIVSQQKDLEKEIEDTYAEMKELDLHLDVIENSLSLIKNGTLVNEYLSKFKKVFVTVLKELTQKTDFNITTSVQVKNGKLDYRFFDRGVEKGYNDLSAGERTRVSLVLLISTIFTLEKVIGFSSNYLVIDEMLGVLDDEGIEMVKKFLELLRREKAVYLITHHEEIPVEFFDSLITFEKTNGVTSLKSIKNLRTK